MGTANARGTERITLTLYLYYQRSHRFCGLAFPRLFLFEEGTFARIAGGLLFTFETLRVHSFLFAPSSFPFARSSSFV